MEENQQFRVTIMSGGCAGYRYYFGIEEKCDFKEDITLLDYPKIVIDDYTCDLISGSEIDWVQNRFGSKFEIKNLNAGTCGCGISFNPRD